MRIIMAVVICNAQMQHIYLEHRVNLAILLVELVVHQHHVLRAVVFYQLIDI